MPFLSANLSLSANILLPSGFSDLKLVSNYPWWIKPERPIPVDLFPINSFVVGEDIINSAILLSLPDFTSSVLIGTGTVGASVSTTVGVPTGFIVKMNRKSCFLNIGPSYSPIGIKSPRLGFNIGKEFKHQVYMSLVGNGFGWTLAFRPVWVVGVVNSGIEYATNSKLKTVYLENGIIQEKSTSSFGGVSYVMLKIADNQFMSTVDTAVNSGLPVKLPKPMCGGCDITIWTKNGKKTYEGNKGTPSEKNPPVLLKPAGSTAWIGIRSDKIDPDTAAGDFFTLSEPWVVEDPMLIHEYNPRIETTGSGKNVISTVEQRVNFPFQSSIQNTGKISGFWIDQVDEQTGLTLKSLYSDDPDGTIPLPESGSGLSEVGAMALYGELSKKAGGISDGWDKIKKEQLPVILAVTGMRTSHASQNISNGCLEDMYVKIESDFYKIIRHFRDDSIEIEQYPVTNPTKSIYEANPAGKYISISSLPLWVTTEMYPGPGNSGGSTPTRCWEGIVSKAEQQDNYTKITWTGYDVLASSAASNGTSASGSIASLSNAKDLTKRYRFNSFDGVGSVIPGVDGVCSFVKYNNWLLVDVNSGTTFKIYDMTFAEKDASTGLQTITASIEKSTSFDGYKTQIYKVGVLFDTPYDLSTELAPKMFNIMQGAIGTTGGSKFPNALNVQGYYTTGEVVLPSDISSTRRFALVDFSFGLDQELGGGAGGTPFVYMASAGGNPPCISLIEHANEAAGEFIDRVIYPDINHYNALVVRSGTKDWATNLSQNMAIIGAPEGGDLPYTIQPKQSGSSWYGDPFVVGAYASFKLARNSTTDDSQRDNPDFYCFAANQKISNGEVYFSHVSTGKSGMVNDFTLQNETFKDDVGKNGEFNMPFLKTPAFVSGDNELEQDCVLSSKVYFKSENTESINNVGGFSVFGEEEFKGLVKNGSFPIQIEHEATSVDYVSASKLVRNCIYSTHATGSNEYIMVYGSKTGRFAFGQKIDPDNQDVWTNPPSIDDSDLDPDRHCVNILVSSDSGVTWRNPAISGWSTPALANLSSSPLVVATDFKYASSTIDLVNNTLFIFGYVTERPGTADAFDPQYTSVACYRINLKRLFECNEYLYPMHNADGYLTGTYLQPSVPDELKWWGEFNSTTENESDIADSFIKILGGKMVPQEKVAIKPFSENAFSLDQSIIASVVAGDGSIEIALRDEEIGLFSLSSTDQGLGWGYSFPSTKDIAGVANSIKSETEGTEPAKDKYSRTTPYIYSKEGTCPNFTGFAHIVYFKGDGMYFSQGPGSVSEKEQLIVKGAKPQKIASCIDNRGVMRCYYLDTSSILRCIESSDSGRTWRPPYNW